mgnify:CR=1 FL=1
MAKAMFLIASLCWLVGCTWVSQSRSKLPAVTPVSTIDLEKYVGTWYEIASRPNRFQAGCTGTTATYSLKENGEIKVENKCFEGHLSGPTMEATGRARIPDVESPAKLEVSFFWPFWGDYWVIDLDPEYQYAVVGQPSRKYLWILSRTPQLDDSTYLGIIDRLKSTQYPVDDLKKTVQKTDHGQ